MSVRVRICYTFPVDKNKKVIKRIVLVALSAIWAVGVWLGIQTIPVGIAFQQGQNGWVSVVTVDHDGHESESPRKKLEETGVATFRVNRTAKAFYFRLYNEDAGQPRTWRLTDVRVYGIPAIQAAMVPRFEMQNRLYDQPPTRGDEPLVMTVKAGDPFNLPNVFPYMLHVLVAVQVIVAVSPFLLLVVFMVTTFFWRRFGKSVCNFVNRNGVFCCIVVAIAALTLPSPVRPVSPGLDPSWEWLMNRFAGERVFGEDFVFTYGPLGFLIAPQLYGVNVAIGMAVNFFFSVLFGYLVILIHRVRDVQSGHAAAFLLLALWLLAWPNGMEWKWCLVSVTACALAVFLRELDCRTRMLLLALAAATAVLQSFVKFS